MRNLTFLLVAFVLAIYSVAAIAAGDAPAIEWLRRGVPFLIGAIVVFAWVAGVLSPLKRSGVGRGWPMFARASAAAAVVLAVVTSVASLGGVSRAGMGVAAVFLLALSVWWRDEPRDYEPPAYRWTTDAAGRWVRAVLFGDTSAAQDDPNYDTVVARNALVIPMLFVILIGAFLRLWRLADLPSGCVAAECEAALRLVNSSPSFSSLYDLSAHAIYRVSGDGLYSLRLAGTLLGIATLPVFYWAARPLERAGGAALTTMLLALLPWHIWASRASEPWISAPLLISAAIGMVLRAYASVDRRWWWAAGLAIGALIVDVGAVRIASCLWAVAIVGAGIWSHKKAHVSTTIGMYSTASLLAAIVVVALPALSFNSGADFPPTLAPQTDSTVSVFTAIVNGLLYGGAGPAYFIDNSLLAALPAALAVLGLGQFLRSLRRPYAIVVVAGTVFFAAVVWRVVASGQQIAGPALALLPFALVGAVVASDAIVFGFWRTWRALVPSRYALGGALVVVLMAGGLQALAYARSLQNAGLSATGGVDEAIGRHIAACLAANTYSACVQGDERTGFVNEYSPVIYAPAAALEHPSTRLLLGSSGIQERSLDRLRVLDIARDVPPRPMPDSSVLYLLPIADKPSIDLVKEFYPDATMVALPANDGPARFVVVQVSQKYLLDRQGIEGLYFKGSEYGTPETAVMSSRDGPLAFDWSVAAPLSGAFSVLWDGSLLVPAAGTYLFAVEIPDAGDAAAPAFTLQLDDRLILDTSLGLLEKEEELAEGFYRLSMHYRTQANGDASPYNWAVTWQPPGGDRAVISREALYSPALPDVGLIGAYYAGNDLQGPLITTRKDVVLGAEADLPTPYGVHWRGKLAASRSGEYIFAASSNGSMQLYIDDQEILVNSGHEPVLRQENVGAVQTALLSRDETDDPSPDYVQASIYLPSGWHDIDVRYIPALEEPELRILWQPPGSAPALLPARYLRPELGQLYPGDVALPPPTALLDPGLGDEDFALSFVGEQFAPQTVSPPFDLSPLLIEEMWKAGGACGGDDGQLNAPRGVAVDAASRRVYVADTLNRRIVPYDLATGTELGAFEHADFAEPVDLALGTSGELIILDAVAHPLFRLDTATGEVAPIHVDTTFYRPRGLHVDDLGQILIADTGGGRVVLLDAEGRVFFEWGGQGTVLGTGQPVDVATHDGTMWAVTAEDGRLWRLYDESALSAIPRANTVDGPHLAGLPGHGLFVTDPIGRTIRFHADSGQPLLQFANLNTFVSPVGVAAAEADGMFYLAVTDSAACTVSLWRGSVAALP